MFVAYDWLPQGAFVLDAQRQVIFWNQQLESWTGIARESILNRPLQDFFPQFSDSLDFIVDKALAEHQPVLLNIPTHQAAIRPLLPSEIESVCGMATAFTTHQTTEPYVLFLVNPGIEEQREMELAALFSAMNDLVFIINREGRYLDIVDTGSPMLSYFKPFIGKTFYDAFPKDKADLFMAATRRVLETGQTQQIEYDLILQGELRWYQATGSPIGEDRILAVARDVTDLKLSEQIARTAEAEQRALLEAISDLVVVNDLEGRFLKFVYRDHFPIVEGGNRIVPGETTLFDVFGHEQAQFFLSNHRKAVETGKTVKVEYSLTIDGEELWFLSFVSPMGQDRVVSVVRDITDLKRAQQTELKLAIERERAQMLANFVNDATHNFRTPLSTINTSVYILGRTQNDETFQRHLNMLNQQTQHLERLIDGLVTMSRLDMQTSFERRPSRFQGIVQNLDVKVRQMAEEKGLALKFDVPDDLPLIPLDEGEMVRALRCLLDNAIQFTEAGEVSLTVNQQDKAIVVQVQDTGCGINAAEIERIFERFYKSDTARSNQIGGLGMGLPIAEKIIHKHGGSLRVDSQPQQGSTFTVTLPLVAPE